MKKLSVKVWVFLNDARGSNMGEYALIGALVLVVAIAAFTSMGTSIASKVTEIAGAI
jgi:Flp pilus assembly pilin Flp